MPFASPTVSRHLLRGAVGLSGLVLALAQTIEREHARCRCEQ